MERRRFWHGLQDAALALALACAGVAEAFGLIESVLGDGSPVVSSIGVVLAAALLSQRRLRTWLLPGVFVVWLVIGVLTLGHMQSLFWGQLVPFVLALYSLARHGRGRLPWIGAGAAATALLLADVFLPVLQGADEIVFHWTVCAVGFAAGWGLRTSEARAVAAAIRARAAETEAREQAEAAVTAERSRIARELHDVLAHSVSVMVVQAGAAEQVVDEDPEYVRGALAAIRVAGTSSLDEVRRIVSLLREPDAADGLAPQPDIAAIGELVTAARSTGLEVDLEMSGAHEDVPPGLGLAAYRIVQEALTNVRKHSGARRAQVAVRCDPESLTIEVVDYGTGAAGGSAVPAAPGTSGARDASAGPGHGLIGMRERAAIYGGRLDAGASADGFLVRAVFPRAAT
ncbi:sensor histidine kinase [Agromyces laixinhei]|uniref:sensor histidine kinase n=1 Tax=Agromyces laixinhei TaxID=2585717 RepID=UPI00143D3213|nr:histidine kinase [Agromyces laixinhei]